MPNEPDQFDFFVSYSSKDNKAGWITRFVEQLQEEHRKYSGGRTFRVFFDEEEIRSLGDWRHRIYESLAASRLLVAFISPNYFASEWCRREWRTWIDVEISKHILSDGAAPIYLVEVPWMGKTMKEQEVAEEIARLYPDPVASLLAGITYDAVTVTGQVAQRQLTKVQRFYDAGIEALRREDLRRILADLANNLSARSEHVEAAARSRSTIPPYNRRFVGRLDELALLRERLHQGRTGVISGHKGDLPEDKSTVASIHGLGGIGKTELAFTYAHAFAGLYPGGRFLVPCEGRVDFQQAMLALDEIFHDGISDQQRKSLDDHFRAIRDCLRLRLSDEGRILLVLDNVTDRTLLNPEQTDHIRVLGTNLHLLATTRLGAPEGDGAYGDVLWVTLGELSFADSILLLEKYRPFETPFEQASAERIARRLGGFALCVEVVGAYLSQHPEQSYARFLETMGITDLEAVDLTAERRDVTTRRHNNEKRLDAVLAPTLASLSSPQLTALEYASLLAPDYVVIPWLQSLVQDNDRRASNNEKNSRGWSSEVQGLLGLALLTRTSDGEGSPRIVRCHRLVQELVRRRMNPEESTKQQQAVGKLVNERDEFLRNTTNWQTAQWELHALDALAHLWADRNDPRDVGLLNSMGQRWQALAEWTNAQRAMRRALEVTELRFGPDGEDAAICLSNLGLLLHAINSLSEAESLTRRALAINEAVLGSDHPTVEISLHNLAGLLAETNRLQEAEPLARRALANAERNFGPDHPRVAIGLGNLAGILEQSNRLPEAERLMRRALAIDEKCMGHDHPDVARRLSNLARLLTEVNQRSEAEHLIRRALAITETSFGSEHPRVAICIKSLAHLLHASNRLTEAEPLKRRAVAIDEQSYGPDHTEVATSLNNLANLLQDTNRMSEAEPLYRRALAIDEKSYGMDHPKVAGRLNNLAQLLRMTNRLDEAERLTRRALAIDEKSFGRNHTSVANRLKNLAGLLHEKGRFAEGEQLTRRALAIEERSFGPDHPEVAASLNNLAQLLQALNHPEEAEPLMLRAIAIEEQNFGPDHPRVALALNNLAMMLQDTGRGAEAEALFYRQLKILIKASNDNHREHPRLRRSIMNYSALNSELGLAPRELVQRLRTIDSRLPSLFQEEIAKLRE